MGNLFTKADYKDILYREIKDIKSKYFPLMNKLIRNNFDEGLNEDRIKNNMYICLEQKCFDEKNDSVEPIKTHYINWLDYLYNYLARDLKDKQWANEMIKELDAEPFLTENKYLSHFFFKEFYLNNEPKCLKDQTDNENDTNNNELYDEYTGNNDVDLRISMNNSNLNMMRNLGGTFMANSRVEVDLGDDNDNENDNNNRENEVEKKYKEFRNKVKKYIYIFKEHIVYKDHPINKVIQIFEKVWVKYAEKKIEFLSNFDDTENNNYNINSMVDDLTHELQNFVLKMQNCLKLFYCKTIDFSCFSNEKDELINLLTTLVFRTGNIYETIFKLQKIRLKEDNDDMNTKYLQLKNITPQQLGIEKQFCLNEETLDMQEEILKKEQTELEKNEEKEDNKTEDKNKKEEDNIYKDTAIFFITDELMDKRKIQSLLADIENKKIKLQNYIENETNNMKVDIDFDDKNNNNLLNINDINKLGSLYDESRMGSILPQSRMSIDFDKIGEDNKGKNDFDLYIPNNTKIKNNKDNMITSNINDGNDNLIIRDNKEINNAFSPFRFIKVFNRVSFYKDPDKSDFISLPYETAIQLLKQIERYKAPFEKMLIFASLGNEIKNCIDDFWKDMEDYITKDLLGVEAEQLMTIFIYIISKARIEDIMVHCQLIKLFTTSMTKSSMIGYYYTNAEASVTFIQTLKNVKELIKKGNIFDINDNNSNI